MKIPTWILPLILGVVQAAAGWAIVDTINQLREIRTELSAAQTQIAVLKSEATVQRDPPAWFIKRMDELAADMKELKAQVARQGNRSASASPSQPTGGPVIGFGSN